MQHTTFTPTEQAAQSQPKRITVGELLMLGALGQFRREVRAGLRPSDTLAFAAGLELAASCWRLAGRRDEASRCIREAAAAIADATELTGAV